MRKRRAPRTRQQCDHLEADEHSSIDHKKCRRKYLQGQRVRRSGKQEMRNLTRRYRLRSDVKFLLQLLNHLLKSRTKILQGLSYRWFSRNSLSKSPLLNNVQHISRLLHRHRRPTQPPTFHHHYHHLLSLHDRETIAFIVNLHNVH